MRQKISQGTVKPASLSKSLLAALFAVLFAFAFALSSAYFDVPEGHADEPAVDDALVAQDSQTVQDFTAGSDTIWSPLVTQASNVEVGDLLLVDFDGATSWLSDDYQGKEYIVIGGSYDCSNTQNAVKKIYSYLKKDTYPNLSFLVLDVNNEPESFGSYSSYQIDRLRFCTGIDYSDWAFDVWSSYSGSYDCATLPFVFAVDENGCVLLAKTGPCDMAGFIEEAYGLSAEDDDPEVVSPNVATPTQEEIIERMAQDDVMLGLEDTYDIEPVLNTEMGELSEETKTLALGMLNTVRLIAGLDEVVLDDDYGEIAQAAAFVDSSISILTHYPASASSQPEGMLDDVWELGCYGASRSNMACGYGNLSLAMLEGWIGDSDCSNVSKVGHRRWCLNPDMGATGFGSAQYYYAMYSMDESGIGSQSNVVWPAQNMPYEFFDTADAWSISVGEYIETASEVTVTLTRKNDGKVWVFDELSSSTSDSGQGFYISNDYCGQPGCIIFRPSGVSYKPGDEFHVEAANVNGKTIVYDVVFFEGFPGYHDPDDPDDPYNPDDPDDPDDPYGPDDPEDDGIDLDFAEVEFPARYADSDGWYVFTSGKSANPVVTVDGQAVPASAYSVEYIYINSYSWDESSVGSKFPKKPGYYRCEIYGSSPNYGSTCTYFEVVKAPNPLIAKAKKTKFTVKYSKLKKKTQTITKAKAFAVEGNVGSVTFSKKSGNKKISITKEGKVKVGKGLKKRTYNVKVNVTAAGNTYYKSVTRVVALKIVVK